MSYRVIQDGLVVAASDTHSDAFHYAMVYGQDGPVELQEKSSGKWKTLFWFNELHEENIE